METGKHPIHTQPGTGPLLAMYPCPGFDAPFEERIAAAAEAGFSAVALDFEEEILPRETPWENQLRLAQRCRLPVEHVHLTGAGMNGIWEDTDAADALCSRALRELERMKALGIRCGVLHVTWGLRRPDALPGDAGLLRFARIADRAEALGVYAALENSVFPEYLSYLLDRIDSTHLGFCFDSGHENAFSPGYGYLAKYSSRLFTMHLHDNNGTRDDHAIPFEGSADWDGICRGLLPTEAARRCITLECAKTADEPLFPWAKRAYFAALRIAHAVSPSSSASSLSPLPGSDK